MTTTTPTPETVYEQVWKPLTERGGSLDMQTVKELLFDYGALLSETSVLYVYLTEGAITNPQEPVDDVIDIADRLAGEAIDAGIRSVLNHLMEELSTVSAEPAETQLKLLTDSINSLYELGQEEPLA